MHHVAGVLIAEAKRLTPGVSERHAALAETDLDGLVKRAQRQRELLEDGRREVARTALAP